MSKKALLWIPKQGSAFDPTTLFSSNTGGWWDPSDMSTLFKDTAGTVPCTAAGDLVARINDKSGNGNDLINSISSDNYLPLRNSGSLWWLEVYHVPTRWGFAYAQGLFASFTFAQPITRVTAAKSVAWVADGDHLWVGSGPNNGGLRSFNADPTISISCSPGTDSPTSNNFTTADHVVTEIINGASSKLAIDNGSYATGNPGTNDPSGVCIGANGPSTALQASFEWYGAIHIGRVLTDPEIANCRTFFGNLAGLSL